MFGNVSDPQSHLDLINDGGSICAVSIGDSGVLFVGIVAEQEHLFAAKGVFGPVDVRQRAIGCRVVWMVGVLTVDEVHWCGPR